MTDWRPADSAALRLEWGTAGFADDIAIAAELDSAAVVPVLDGRAFRAESGPP
jgi:hypothetical protein